MTLFREFLSNFTQYLSITISIDFRAKSLTIRCEATWAFHCKCLRILILISVLISTALLRTRAFVGRALMTYNIWWGITQSKSRFLLNLSKATFACQLVIRNFKVFDWSITYTLVIRTSEIILTFTFSFTCLKDTLLFLACFLYATEQTCITIRMRFTRLEFLLTFTFFFTFSTLALKVIFAYLSWHFAFKDLERVIHASIEFCITHFALGTVL